ncbi:MAG: 50S ribosomal protein L4 [Chlamydiae bacterium]|nr:50S ribosomal protein L4 [Chlamydiota bacterium]
MTTVKKYDLSGKETGEVKIEKKFLISELNSQLIKDYIVALRANARQWSANTKTRFEVNHSGKKPHPQKGTGKARQGYLGAPQYRGGGRVFAPRPKFDQHVQINKKEKKAAIRYLLSEKIQSNHLHILTNPDLEGPKTKSFSNFLQNLGFQGRKVLFLTLDPDSNIHKSVRNIPAASILLFPNINGYDLARNQEIILLEPVVKELLSMLGRN